MNAATTGLDNVIQEGTLQDITEGNTNGGSGGSFSDLFVNTPTIKAPTARNTMNAARITGVTEETTNGGTTFVKVHVALTDEGKDTDMAIFLPNAFIASIKVDPTTLSDEETINSNGVTVPSEQTQYSRSVHNSADDATLDTLGRIAKEAGQSIGQPSTFSELVSALNSALTGVDVYALRSVDRSPKNPEFANVLRVRKIVSTSVETGHKRYAGYFKPFQQ